MLRKLSLLAVAAALASGASAVTCPSEPVTSCSEDATSVDDCCVNRPGGLMLFRQRFEPDEGDEGKWGIDGLEIMNQEQVGSFCARSARIGPEYESYENEWAASEVGESVEEIWERNVPLFFAALHQLHDSLPTYQLLADSNITPSQDTTYSLDEVIAALSVSGFNPSLTCSNETLTAVHWPINSIGPFQDTTFAPSDFDGSSRSNCPSDGIVYPPAEQIFRTAEYTWDPMAKPSMRPLLQVTRSSASQAASATEGLEGIVGEAFAPHQKKVVQHKLGLFKQKDGKLQDEKDRQFGEDAKRHKRDEL
ncbi:hypothetical protein QFC21_002932 [Naganishia friedmannii]|uniref:Uncharacterized protein n=1 Tax=Naganishia friedmannii TaxID=89922 RepID=A0ACC2VTS9_9TREE|nr:hypothetical protein QFC21_002932 [Naganishia friedmannii]